MIQDESHTRALRNQIDSDGKLAGQYAKITGESVALQSIDILNESHALAQIIWLSVQHPADAFQFGVTSDLVQVSLEIVLLGTCAGDYAGEQELARNEFRPA